MFNTYSEAIARQKLRFNSKISKNKPEKQFEYQRKKYKSCSEFVNRSWSCSSNPNSQACEKYVKRKK